jgi:hypothetical protein
MSEPDGEEPKVDQHLRAEQVTRGGRRGGQPPQHTLFAVPGEVGRQPWHQAGWLSKRA